MNQAWKQLYRDMNDPYDSRVKGCHQNEPRRGPLSVEPQESEPIRRYERRNRDDRSPDSTLRIEERGRPGWAKRQDSDSGPRARDCSFPPRLGRKLATLCEEGLR